MVGLITVYRHNLVRGHLEQKVHIKCYFRLRLCADLGNGLSSTWEWNWSTLGMELDRELGGRLMEDWAEKSVKHLA